MAGNLGNFLRTLALPETVEYWSLTTLREKLIKIGAKIVRRGRNVTFQLAAVAIPRTLFAARPIRRSKRGHRAGIRRHRIALEHSPVNFTHILRA